MALWWLQRAGVRWRRSHRCSARRPGRVARHDASAGFSLMEVVVALAVLSALMAALFSGLGQSWRDIRLAQQQARVMALAQTRLAAIGRDVPLGEGRLAAGEDERIAWTVTGERYGTAFSARPSDIVIGAAGAGSVDGATPPPPSATWLVFDATWPDGKRRSVRSLRVRSLRLGDP